MVAKAIRRTEPLCVAKRSDDLRLEVICQTNQAIAGSPRNVYRYSGPSWFTGGRDTERDGGGKPHFTLPNSEYR